MNEQEQKVLDAARAVVKLLRELRFAEDVLRMLILPYDTIPEQEQEVQRLQVNLYGAEDELERAVVALDGDPDTEALLGQSAGEVFIDEDARLEGF